MEKKKTHFLYKLIRRIGLIFFPKFKVEGFENIEGEPCIIGGNHCQVYGPIACELYMKGNYAIWCAGETMDKKVITKYAFEAFWSRKPKWTHWFYKLIAKIGPLVAQVFIDAHTVPVYRDIKVMKTFHIAMEKLEKGYNNILFLENYMPHNNIINDFKRGFVDMGRFYYKKTGKILKFAPMYVAPALKTIYIGKPIAFDPNAKIEDERERIPHYLMDAITEIATSLPNHRVVPFANTTKKDRPMSLPLIDRTQEKTKYTEFD